MMYYVGRWWPVVTATLITFLFYKMYVRLNDVSNIIEKLLNTALTVSGTLLGFLLTITTIISTIDTRRMRFVRQQGGYAILQYYMKSAIVLNLITIIVSFICPILGSLEKNPMPIIVNHCAAVFIISWTLFVSVRFSYVFINLLHDKEIE